MRTTLAIDDDIMAAARHLAARQKLSMGEVISALARQGLRQTSTAQVGARNGVPLLQSPPGATPITLDMVNQWRDEAA